MKNIILFIFILIISFQLIYSQNDDFEKQFIKANLNGKTRKWDNKRSQSKNYVRSEYHYNTLKIFAERIINDSTSIELWMFIKKDTSAGKWILKPEYLYYGENVNGIGCLIPTNRFNLNSIKFDTINLVFSGEFSGEFKSRSNKIFSLKKGKFWVKSPQLFFKISYKIDTINKFSLCNNEWKFIGFKDKQGKIIDAPSKAYVKFLLESYKDTSFYPNCKPYKYGFVCDSGIDYYSGSYELVNDSTIVTKYLYSPGLFCTNDYIMTYNYKFSQYFRNLLKFNIINNILEIECKDFSEKLIFYADFKIQ
jgi:hypothetical protein